MTIFCWFLTAWFFLGAIVTITSIGKPRRPSTPNQAAVVVLINMTFALFGGLVATGVLR